MLLFTSITSVEIRNNTIIIFDMILAFGRKIGHNILQKRTLTTTQPICAIPNLRNYSNAQNGGFSGNFFDLIPTSLVSCSPFCIYLYIFPFVQAY